MFTDRITILFQLSIAISKYMRLPMRSDYCIFYLRRFVSNCLCKRQNHILTCEYLVVKITVGHYMVNIPVIRMKLIVSKFILHPQKDKNSTDHTNTQT